MRVGRRKDSKIFGEIMPLGDGEEKEFEDLFPRRCIVVRGVRACFDCDECADLLMRGNTILAFFVTLSDLFGELLVRVIY